MFGLVLWVILMGALLLLPTKKVKFFRVVSTPANAVQIEKSG
jgi:hypothetical protein